MTLQTQWYFVELATLIVVCFNISVMLLAKESLKSYEQFDTIKFAILAIIVWWSFIWSENMRSVSLWPLWTACKFNYFILILERAAQIALVTLKCTHQRQQVHNKINISVLAKSS